MKLEYMQLKNDSIHQILTINLSKLDKLFLDVERKWFFRTAFINIHRSNADALTKLDPSKVILFLRDNNDNNSRYVDYIKIKDLPKFEIVFPDDSYLYQNYNFIHTTDKYYIIARLLINKINILMDFTLSSYIRINDKLRLRGSEIFVDIIIQPGYYTTQRYLKKYFDVRNVMAPHCCHPMPLINYIQLDGLKIYLNNIL